MSEASLASRLCGVKMPALVELNVQKVYACGQRKRVTCQTIRAVSERVSCIFSVRWSVRTYVW